MITNTNRVQNVGLTNIATVKIAQTFTGFNEDGVYNFTKKIANLTRFSKVGLGPSVQRVGPVFRVAYYDNNTSRNSFEAVNPTTSSVHLHPP